MEYRRNENFNNVFREGIVMVNGGYYRFIGLIIRYYCDFFVVFLFKIFWVEKIY